ncbi:MAG: winged helix-turn-helix domain-containing protein, partial [Boseongicola sp.]|nr:winged helix-turn-helix domain-containing protein [Boseongicola sp.]
MNDHSNTQFSFENFDLNVDAAELRKNGELVPLEPQVFDLLVLLIQNSDRVVSKDEIIESVWNGRFVSESAVSTRINALRRALGDDGTEQRLIKTVHGRGFRFGVQPQKPDSVPTNEATGVSGIAEKPSIAIVPLRPLSGDVELEYFADGIAEEIINALSRFHELAVIARNSSFTFKGKSTPAQEIAKSLGVKYVLEGSVRQVAERIRVAVQLVDAEAGHTIWSDRYDGDLSDIFEVQDEIAAKAVNSIAPQTQYAEMASAYRKEMTSLSDWEKVMRARWHMDKYSKEHTEEALQILSNVVGSSS